MDKLSPELSEKLLSAFRVLQKYTDMYPGGQGVLVSMVNSVVLDGKDPDTIPLSGIFALISEEDTEILKEALVAVKKQRDKIISKNSPTSE